MAKINNKIQGMKSIPLTELDVFKFGNPRVMTDAMVASLTKSMEEAFVEPIVVRVGDEGDYEIINGHHRFQVAKDLGWKDIPCVIIDLPDDDMARALVVGLNRIDSDWDVDQLNDFVNAAKAAGADMEWFADISGLRHDGLESLADLGTDFLALNIPDLPDVDEEEDGPQEAEADEGVDATTLAPITFNMPPLERKALYQVLKNVQRKYRVTKNVDALIWLMDDYRTRHGMTKVEKD